MDPRRFGDSVALKTRWDPAAPHAGASFRTHRLVEAAPGRLEFRATAGNLGFGAVMVVAGLGASVMAITIIVTQDDWRAIFVGLIALAFVAGGVVHLRSEMRHRVFDRGARAFWIGKKPHQIPPGSAAACRLSDIHALQLIDERIQTRERDEGGRWRINVFHSVELNLVLKNGERIPVVDHAKLDMLRSDAARLAQLSAASCGTRSSGPLRAFPKRRQPQGSRQGRRGPWRRRWPSA